MPILGEAIENADALLPTHILAVYDQDATLDATSDLSLPYTSSIPSGPSPLPATPLMVPVNAELWTRHFASSFVSRETSSPVTPPPDRPSSSSSFSSLSSRGSRRDSPLSIRPRRILSLPVHVIRVPAASSLPLLLLAMLGVVSANCLATALLPLPVLAELPAGSVILTEHLLRWLYKRKSQKTKEASSGGKAARARSKEPATGSAAATPHMNLTPPSSAQSSPAMPPIDPRCLSPLSISSYASSSSIISHVPLTLFPSRDAEPICALMDPTTEDDPDLRLLRLAQQNFGLWANALALGAKDSSVVQLVELAWTVAGDARRARFGDPLKVKDKPAGSSRTLRKSRSRPHLPPPDPPQAPLPDIPLSR